MEYKVIGFDPGTIRENPVGFASGELEKMITFMANQGWEYVELAEYGTWVPGTSGCFGFGAKSPYHQSIYMAVFRKWMILRLLIRFYWWVVPAPRRRSCLFGESCSRYVFRRSSEGVVAGWAALLERHRQCRPGYRIVGLRRGGATIVVLADGSAREISEMSDQVRQELARASTLGGSFD